MSSSLSDFEHEQSCTGGAELFEKSESENASVEHVIELELVQIAEGTTPPAHRKLGWTGGLFLSVLFHVWLCVTSAGIILSHDIPFYHPPKLETTVRIEEENPLEQEVIDYELVDPNDKDFEVRQVINAASIGQSFSEKMPLESAPVPVDFSLPPEPRHQAYDIPEGKVLSDQIVVKGLSNYGVIQIESALDRVTWEIAQKLQERKVLVVWLLDASGSLSAQRAAVAKRLEQIYSELDALENEEQIPRLQQALLSGVVTYGEKTHFITKEPTGDFEKIRDAIASTKNDPSGKENIFTAITHVMKRWKRYRTSHGREIMIIVVTDESGDDFPMHEKAIKMCRRSGARAYVIGPTAVFGRKKGFVSYVAPEDGKSYNLPVDLGPETAMFDLVDLPFWFNGPQHTYLSAGFGPYALSRLVRETGGIYFTTNMTTMKGFGPTGTFNTEALRPFEPNYQFGTEKKYFQHLKKHPLRYAVINAARLSRINKSEGTPKLDLRVTARNFRQSATTAQKTVARSQLMVESILQAFPPQIEKELAKEQSPRWRMTFCLSYGRLLAQKVRCYEYNYACAWLKGSLTEQDINTNSNHWIFKPSKKINYATTMKRTAETAEKLLNLVIEEAPGTPWAVLAARELQHPFGMQIEQQFIPPPPKPKPRKANPQPKKPRLLLAPSSQKKKPKPKPPKPPKPQLPNL